MDDVRGEDDVDCARCPKIARESFPGETRADRLLALQESGWDAEKDVGFLCPSCSGWDEARAPEILRDLCEKLPPNMAAALLARDAQWALDFARDYLELDDDSRADVSAFFDEDGPSKVEVAREKARRGATEALRKLGD